VKVELGKSAMGFDRVVGVDVGTVQCRECVWIRDGSVLGRMFAG
jgi:N-acetylglucosamine kinase-like BadF-type ATPase